MDAQSIVEEIQGMVIDEIMNPDFPTPNTPNPAYRHLQYVPPGEMFGYSNPPTNTIANQPNLLNERARVWYGTAPDTSSTVATATCLNEGGPTGSGLYTYPVGTSTVINNLASFQHMTLPLPIVAGSDSTTYPLGPTTSRPGGSNTSVSTGAYTWPSTGGPRDTVPQTTRLMASTSLRPARRA